MVLVDLVFDDVEVPMLFIHCNCTKERCCASRKVRDYF